jgi:hypothetical protein
LSAGGNFTAVRPHRRDPRIPPRPAQAERTPWHGVSGYNMASQCVGRARRRVCTRANEHRTARPLAESG